MEGNRPGESLHFGPRDISKLSLASINELTQIRQEYDDEALDELKASLVKKPKDADQPLESDDVNLNNAIVLAKLDVYEADEYLQKHAEYYDSFGSKRLTLWDLTWQPDDTTYILIAGHRRLRAMTSLADEHGMPLDEVTVAANIHDGISFRDALPLQATENIYKRPPAVDEAAAIDRYYKFLIRQGEKPSIKDVAEYFGYKETKVRDALAFATLPRRIQSFAVDGLIPYSTIRQLEPVARAYQSHYSSPQGVEDRLVVICNKMLTMDLKGDTDQKRAQMIKNILKDLKDLEESQQTWQPELFFIESLTPEYHRKDTSRKLGIQAVGITVNLASNDELDAETLATMITTLQEAQARVRDRQSPSDMVDLFA